MDGKVEKAEIERSVCSKISFTLKWEEICRYGLGSSKSRLVVQ